MRKRGALSTLNALIIFSLTTIILFLFVTSIGDFIQAESDKDGCKLSVSTASTVKGLIDINCFTQFITFKKDSAYQKSINRNEKKIASVKANREDFVKQIVANQMVDCWDQFYEGEALPFSSDEGLESQRCVVCSKLKFEPSFTNKMTSKSITNFEEWLENNPIPGTSKKYKEFLSNTRTQEIPFWFDEEFTTTEITNEIDLTKIYYIVYTQRVPSIFRRVAQYVSVNEAQGKPTLFVMPVDDFQNLGCTQLY
jgi:hypothetical protein